MRLDTSFFAANLLANEESSLWVNIILPGLLDGFWRCLYTCTANHPVLLRPVVRFSLWVHALIAPHSSLYSR